MQINFRTRLTALVGITALGFIVLIAANILVTHQVEQQLEKIHQNYIPLIELGPRLEAQFGGLKRSLQDAVAAQDVEALAATGPLKDKLLADLGTASGVISPAEVSSLQTTVGDYYTVAYNVSQRLMRGETGEGLVNAMGDMKSKHEQTSGLLKSAIGFDQAKLAAAFVAISNSQSTAGKLQLLISLLCLVFVTGLSFWIRRGVLRSLESLTMGLAHFSRGDFDQAIRVVSNDELGHVAIQANHMAKQIQTLVDKLAVSNRELEAFSYSVAHDLRTPLRATLGFSNILMEDYSAALPPAAQELLSRVAEASKKMRQLIDGLLSLSRITRETIAKETVDLSVVAQSVMATLQESEPERRVQVTIQKDIIVQGDPRLLHAALANLMGNAWKFTKKKPDAQIEFGTRHEEGRTVFFVQDNGAGFNMSHAERLFGTFQRLHTIHEFEGTGIGLATVQRIIHRHDGKIWAKAEPGKGAIFNFTLG